MDKELKEVLIYAGGTIFGYAGFLALILQITKELKDIIYSTLFLVQRNFDFF